jgi:hypothetical protein
MSSKGKEPAVPPGKRSTAELREVLSKWDKGGLAPLTTKQQVGWGEWVAVVVVVAVVSGGRVVVAQSSGAEVSLMMCGCVATVGLGIWHKNGLAPLSSFHFVSLRTFVCAERSTAGSRSGVQVHRQVRICRSHGMSNQQLSLVLLRRGAGQALWVLSFLSQCWHHANIDTA